MNISKKLKVAAVVPAVMTLVIGAALFSSYLLVRSLEEEERTAIRINIAMDDLNDLARTYVLRHEERPRQQFLRKQEDTTKLISAAVFGDRQRRQLQERVAKNTEAVKALFLKLVSNYESHHSIRDDDLFKEAEERLVGQYMIRSREAQTYTSRLVDLIGHDVVESQRRMYTLSLALMAVVAVPFAVVLLGLMRSIVASLERLRKGADIVGGGDLDHRIGISSEDEIGAVAKAFDGMTEKLRTATVSRDELAAEVAQRKWTEAALEAELAERRLAEESARHLASFPQMNPNPVLEVDTSGRLIYSNAAARTLLEIQGMDTGDLSVLLPADLDGIVRAWDGKSDSSFYREVVVGRNVLAETVHLVPRSRVARIYVHDITERMRAEEKIRRQNALLEGINRIFREALACDTEEALGRVCLAVVEEMTQSRFGFIDFLEPDGLLHAIAISDPGWELCTMRDKTGHHTPPGGFKVHGLFGRVLLDGKAFFTNDPASHPDRIGTPQGHPPLTAFLGAPLIQGEKIIGMVGLGNREGGYRTEDLDALEAVGIAIVQVFLQKRAEGELLAAKEQLEFRVAARTAELAESEERFRSLVEHSPVGIFIVQGGRIVYRNPEQARLFGPMPENFEFRMFRDVHPEDASKFGELVDSISSGGEPARELDLRFFPYGKSSEGVDLRWVHAITGPMEYGGEKAVLVSMADITRLKEMEHQYLVREKMATLGNVAAGMAHEIRNPLSGINIYLSALEKLYEDAENLDADGQEQAAGIVRQIQSASERIESVIKKVMDFARPSAVHAGPADINLAIENAIDFTAVTVRKRGVTLDRSRLESLPKSNADSFLIMQVVMNLIVNAAQAMEETQGAKVIGVSSAVQDGRIVIRVSDSGPGVPPALREKVFDPFFTTRKDGYGIGLSFSRRVIADHHGLLMVGASRWGGAEFRIELPLESEREAGPAESARW